MEFMRWLVYETGVEGIFISFILCVIATPIIAIVVGSILIAGKYAYQSLKLCGGSRR